MGSPALQEPSLPGGGGLVAGHEVGSVSRDGVEEQQPVLFYSIRSAAGSEEPLPLSGARLEDDPVPVRWEPQSQLAGQVSLVEAGRVHGWACVKGTLGADLAVSVYVDGVEVGRATAVLPTQGAAVNRLCQIEGLLAAQQGQQVQPGDDQQAQPAQEAARTGVGFVVPLPPLEQGVHAVREAGRHAFMGRLLVPGGCCWVCLVHCFDAWPADLTSCVISACCAMIACVDLHAPALTASCPPLAVLRPQLRAFVTAPGGAYKQELGQSPLLFRESSVSPDQEERIRRKDAIIQTRNAQVRLKPAPDVLLVSVECDCFLCKHATAQKCAQCAGVAARLLGWLVQCAMTCPAIAPCTHAHRLLPTLCISLLRLLPGRLPVGRAAHQAAVAQRGGQHPRRQTHPAIPSRGKRMLLLGQGAWLSPPLLPPPLVLLCGPLAVACARVSCTLSCLASRLVCTPRHALELAQAASQAAQPPTGTSAAPSLCRLLRRRMQSGEPTAPASCSSLASTRCVPLGGASLRNAAHG